MEGKINTVRFCKVISVEDDTDADRIKVRLSPEDNTKTIDEIDYAFPLLPKMFHVKPKVGEAVFLLLATEICGLDLAGFLGDLQHPFVERPAVVVRAVDRARQNDVLAHCFAPFAFIKAQYFP